MSQTFMQSFSFIPLMASEKKSFEYFFQKFSLSVAMATNQKQRLGQNSYGWQRTTQKHFCKKYFQNICSNTEINANFHFSHYKSMATKAHGQW